MRQDVWRFIFEMTRDVIRGDAGIDDDALIRLDEFSASFADGFLFGELMRLARAENEFVGGGRLSQARAAVGALQNAGRFHQSEVPANGRDRSIDLFRQFFKGSEFHPFEVGFNAFLAFFCRHLARVWEILIDIAINLLTKFQILAKRAN